MFGFRNDPVKFVIDDTVPGIKAVVSDHFKMLIRDVLNDKLNELNGRNCFFDKRMIFVFMVMKGNHVAIIGVNSGESNDGSAEVACNISNDGVRIAKRGLSIDIKPVFIFTVNQGFG